MGQELIARTHFKGMVRKRLVKVLLSENPNEEWQDAVPGSLISQHFRPDFSLASKEPIMSGEKAVGTLHSRIGNIGIAMLRLEHLNDPLTLIDNGRLIHVKARLPNYLRDLKMPL